MARPSGARRGGWSQRAALLPSIIATLNLVKTCQTDNYKNLGKPKHLQSKERIYDENSLKSGFRFLQDCVVAKFCRYFVLDVAKLSSGPQSEPNYSSRLSGGCIVFECFGVCRGQARRNSSQETEDDSNSPLSLSLSPSLTQSLMLTISQLSKVTQYSKFKMFKGNSCCNVACFSLAFQISPKF